MTVATLLTTLERLGVRICVEDDELRCRGPRNCLTPEIRVALKEHRAALLDMHTSGAHARLIAPRRPDRRDWRSLYGAALAISGTPAESFLAERGVPEQLATQANVRFLGSASNSALVFPILNRRFVLVGLTVHSLTTRKQWSLGAAGVFSPPGRSDAAHRVPLVESPICALSLTACGLPSLGLSGAAWPEWLPGALARRLVPIGFGRERPKAEAANRLAEALTLHEATGVLWTPPLEGEGGWSEYRRLHGEGAFISAVAARIRKVPLGLEYRYLRRGLFWDRRLADRFVNEVWMECSSIPTEEQSPQVRGLVDVVERAYMLRDMAYLWTTSRRAILGCQRTTQLPLPDDNQ